jgi:two-component system, OmpR family, sensor histidine kinase KdpD
LVLAVPGVLVAGLVTLICFGLDASLTIAGFCYLIVVVLQSLAGDFRSTAVVSLLCAGCLDYFFIPPLFSFRVSDLSDTLALITFLVTGLVVTRLVSLSGDAAESEQLQRQEMTHLYHVARSLLSLDPGISIGPELLKPFLTHFALKAVCLFDAESATLHMVGSSDDNLPERTRSAYIEKKNFEDPTSGLAIGLLQAGGKTTGAIGFEGLRDVSGTAGPLTALATLIIEQSLAFKRARDDAARAEAEVFRGAILDALAHEFKTPLTTIVAAAGGIQAAGPLRGEQRQLAEAVESEGLRLEQLTTRLLRLARLDREEVRPRMELIDVGEVVQNLVDQYSKRWADRGISFDGEQSFETIGDKELLRLGIGQLLDNACKYSRPGSPVSVAIGKSGSLVVIDVWNAGTPIPSNERAHIFDRFYRGTAAQKQAPGSGLGLYVARKIAHAHGGKVELDHSNGDQEGVRFRFTIPLANGEPKDASPIQSSGSG